MYVTASPLHRMLQTDYPGRQSNGVVLPPEKIPALGKDGIETFWKTGAGIEVVFIQMGNEKLKMES